MASASPSPVAASAPPVRRDDGTGLVLHDPWLEPHSDKLRARYAKYLSTLAKIDQAGGLLGQVSQGHHYYGFTRGENNGQAGVWYREWAPAARLVTLTGDFNGWDRWNHPLQRDQFGVWSTFLPDERYADKLTHGSRVKVHVLTQEGGMDRLPAYVRRVIQEPGSTIFTGQYWNPPQPYAFKNAAPKRNGAGLRIYEAHIGMASEEPRVGTFKEFTQSVLPRVADLGYNAIQLMAVLEHPYYGSFGYHVSNFYAVSSRFGTPEDLKELIDAAHGMGILVLLDIVHSHAVKNTHEGLNLFDGTEFQYFHAGPRGHHIAWDSKLFDYAKFEVLRFLLSNDRYWLEEYRFDGFRFDGVTSMVYLDHGLGKAFSSYDDYFGPNIDEEALVYLQLANQLIHTLKPDAITIAEDVSGMVGMARPVAEGGIGFDYRLAMGVPDYWIKVLKEKSDEQWNLKELYHTLLNRRWTEKHVGYAESHDQAMVGDKTIAFWLMDKDMYWHMNKEGRNLVIDRGLALHKMIRLITFSLSGEGYLTFMGNEFGHPEWIDFPREGNNWSFHHARRQWSLSDAEYLLYKGLKDFDRAMMKLDDRYHILEDRLVEQLLLHDGDKVVAYRRGPLVFVFNFHPSQSFTDYRIPVPDAKDYKLILNTDDKRFDGFGLVEQNVTYWKQDYEMYGRKQSVQMYLPSRTAQVLAPG
jgi:1,4-alpha-glucan branching enzyme